MRSSFAFDYPVYAVVDSVSDKYENGSALVIDGFLGVEADGRKCLALFSTRELAAAWQNAHPGTKVLAIYERFAELLRAGISRGIRDVVWDAPGEGPYEERVMRIEEVLQCLESQ